MIRRTIQPKERDYLLKELKIRIVPPSHHLTALQSVDVHELMGSEYPEIYASYQRACNERIKMEMIEKQKELEAVCCRIVSLCAMLILLIFLLFVRSDWMRRSWQNCDKKQ